MLSVRDNNNLKVGDQFINRLNIKTDIVTELQYKEGDMRYGDIGTITLIRGEFIEYEFYRDNTLETKFFHLLSPMAENCFMIYRDKNLDELFNKS